MLRPYDAIIQVSASKPKSTPTHRVPCPLCPPKKPHDAPKYYIVGKGLREHLNAKHNDVELDRRYKVLRDAESQHNIIVTNPIQVKREMNPGLQAAKDGDLSLLQHYQSTGVWHCSMTDHHGSTALLWAAGSGHLHVVQWLIETERMDPLARSQRASQARNDGKTALHWAARNGHVAVMDYFINNGSLKLNVDIMMRDGSTPLMLACFGGHLVAAKWLVNEAMANLHHINEHGCDCVHWAAMGGSVDVLAWLDEQNMPLNRTQNEHQTPLHKAAAKRHKAAVAFLSKKYDSDSIEVKDSSGFTAIQLFEAQMT